MIKTLPALGVAILATTALSGCSGGSTPKKYGGAISLLAMSLGTNSVLNGYGAFFESYSPPAGFDPFEIPAPNGSCAPFSPKGPATFVSLDAGESVGVMTGATSLTYHRNVNPGIIDYAPNEFPPPVFDAPYDITFAGSGDVAAQTFPASILLPKQVTLITPAATVLSNGNSVFVSSGLLAWEPTGAQLARVSLGPQSGIFSFECFFEDNGTFEIPAAILALAPSSGVLTFATSVQKEIELNGRFVETYGVSEFMASYTRP